jgi:hypothetical protein
MVKKTWHLVSEAALIPSRYGSDRRGYTCYVIPPLSLEVVGE